MDREAVRLECLRLRFRHDHTVDQIIRDAKSLEEYVAGPDEGKPVTPKAPNDKPSEKKKPGNPDLFS